MKLLIAIIALLFSSLFHHVHASSHNISAIFAFGDSTLDSGNNNHLPTMFRADHPPYGQDFPRQVATGRFSDGKLITDLLVSGIGLKETLPPYLAGGLSGFDLATGVSFASAGSGLDELTATISNVMTIPMQVNYFRQYMTGLNIAIGKAEADRLIREAVFVIGAGSNDMMINFYMMPMRSRSYTVPQYQRFLLSKMRTLLEQLHRMGARKFTVSGLPPIGCLPLQITMQFNSTGTPGAPARRTCVTQHNKDSMAYNLMLQNMLKTLPLSLSGSKFIYIDIFNPLMDMIKKPLKYGFIETTVGCCGTGLVEVGPFCARPLISCPFPGRFMFWDSVHPSQAAYQALAKEFMRDVLPQLTA